LFDGKLTSKKTVVIFALISFNIVGSSVLAVSLFNVSQNELASELISSERIWVSCTKASASLTVLRRSLINNNSASLWNFSTQNAVNCANVNIAFWKIS